MNAVDWFLSNKYCSHKQLFFSTYCIYVTTLFFFCKTFAWRGPCLQQTACTTCTSSVNSVTAVWRVAVTWHWRTCCTPHRSFRCLNMYIFILLVNHQLTETLTKIWSTVLLMADLFCLICLAQLAQLPSRTALLVWSTKARICSANRHDRLVSPVLPHVILCTRIIHINLIGGFLFC